MSIVRNLIPKKLTLIKRSWVLKNGRTRSVYRARIWQSKVKRNTEITLTATDEASACEEAFSVWAKHAHDIQDGRDIGSKRRQLTFFIEEFLEVQAQRARDQQITPKRVEVQRHSLASLRRFWEEEGKPGLDDLARLVDIKWHNWRSRQTAQKTGKPLSARFRNGELSVQKQFFLWSADNRYAFRVPKIEPLKLKRANEPFPSKYYQKLLAVSRKDIQNERNPRVRWNWMNYRYVMIVMNGIGCRVAEIKNMKWEHIQKKGDATLLYIHGKDKERTIQLPERIAGYLEDLRDFKTKTGDGWWSEQTHSYVFNAYKRPKCANHFDPDCRRRWTKEAGVPNPEDYEYVCFRHKFITEALNAGAHSLTVAKYTGTSQAMIEKTYEGLVSGDVFNLVFRNAPAEALARKTTPEWLRAL